MPADASLAATASADSSDVRSTAWTAVPKMLVFSTSGMASSVPMALTASRARISRIGRARNMPFSSLTVPSAASRPACMMATR